jgi:hypothetical protein
VQHRADVINFHKKRKNSGLTFGLAVKKWWKQWIRRRTRWKEDIEKPIKLGDKSGVTVHVPWMHHRIDFGNLRLIQQGSCLLFFEQTKVGNIPHQKAQCYINKKGRLRKAKSLWRSPSPVEEKKKTRRTNSPPT